MANSGIAPLGWIYTGQGPGVSPTFEPPSSMSYYSLTPYIVGPVGDVHSQYSTIASAISAAVTAGASSTNPANIYIKPKSGGYTENVTLSDGINLIGFGGNTTINGKISITTTSTCYIQNLTLNTNSDYFLEVTGSISPIIYLTTCNLLTPNSNGIHCTASSGDIRLQQCVGDCGSNTYFVFSGGGLRLRNSQLVSSTSPSASTFANANFESFNSEIVCGITTSGTGSFSSSFSSHFNEIIADGTGTNLLNNSRVESQSASAISIGTGVTLPVLNTALNSSNTNVITGLGTLKYALISFYGSSSGVNVSTATPFATLT